MTMQGTPGASGCLCCQAFTVVMCCQDTMRNVDWCCQYEHGGFLSWAPFQAVIMLSSRSLWLWDAAMEHCGHHAAPLVSSADKKAP